jgi:hypothetical protein
VTAAEAIALIREMLVGQPLIGSARAADMEMFAIGPVVSRKGIRGVERDVSRFAVHIQGPWRIVDGGSVLVGYDDLRTPRSDHPNHDEFNPNTVFGASRREELLAAWFDRRATQPRTVVTCELDDWGDLRVVLDDGSAIITFADGSSPDTEFWRVLDNGAHHIVARGSGITIEPPVTHDPADATTG